LDSPVALTTSVADPHHFDADPDPDFYLMRMRIRIRLFTLMRIRIRILASKERLEPLKMCSNKLFQAFWLTHLQIDADPDPDPNPAYHFDRILIFIR
jgi:hypothetical protein